MYTETKYRKLKISSSYVKNTFKMYEKCKRVKLQKSLRYFKNEKTFVFLKPRWSTRSQKGSQLAVYKMMIKTMMMMMMMIMIVK